MALYSYGPGHRESRVDQGAARRRREREARGFFYVVIALYSYGPV